MTDYVDLAISLNNLGMAESHIGNLQTALHYFEQALAKMKQAAGDRENSPHYQDFLKIQDNLGDAYRILGNFDKALEYCKGATEAVEKKYGETYPELGTFYFNLGKVYLEQENFTLAQHYFQKAHKVNLLHLPSDHPDIARDLWALGTMLDKRGDYLGAVEFLEKALAIEEERLGPDHPTLIATYAALGFALIGAKKLSTARQFYQKAYDLAKRINDPAETEMGKILVSFDGSDPLPVESSQPETSPNILIISDSVFVKGSGKVLMDGITMDALWQFIAAEDLFEASQIINEHLILLDPIVVLKMKQLIQEQIHPLAKKRIEERYALLVHAQKEKNHDRRKNDELYRQRNNFRRLLSLFRKVSRLRPKWFCGKSSE